MVLRLLFLLLFGCQAADASGSEDLPDSDEEANSKG